MTFDKSKLSAFPTSPGVYLMKDKKGEILYVGKANNLRSRVRQYFGPSGDGRAKVPHLVARIDRIDTIVVNSEKEALLLENTLIKQHRPKYNAFFRDDKSYVNLRITKHKWPLIELVRYKGKPKSDAHYFGPYTSSYAAKQTLDLLNKLFPLRQCSDREFASRKRPCLLHQIGKCCAPCVGLVSQEQYDGYVDQASQFLKGKNKHVLKRLYHQMEDASESLEFEQAGRILKTIRYLEQTVEQQKVFKALGKDIDVIGIHRSDPTVVLIQLFFRDGRLVGSRHHELKEIAEDDGDIVQSFILQRYTYLENPPHEVIVPCLLPDQELVQEVLSEDKSHKVIVHHPQRGDKRAHLEMAQKNARAVFDKEKDEHEIREQSLNGMQKKFHLANYPRRIECFDTSNLAGSEPVASMVVFVDGKKAASEYRKYKIQTTEIPDDYAAMHEVLTRRFNRGKAEGTLPDLIILDGGKGQLNIARKVLKELNVISVDLISLVKEDARHDKGMTAERVYIPEVRDPIHLPRSSPVLFLLQNIRDEAHRVAITFHRQRRSKTMIGSVLDTVPGIGPVKRKRLLAKFGSVKKIKKASSEELAGTKGISLEEAQRILEYLNQSTVPRQSSEEPPRKTR